MYCYYFLIKKKKKKRKEKKERKEIQLGTLIVPTMANAIKSNKNKVWYCVVEETKLIAMEIKSLLSSLWWKTSFLCEMELKSWIYFAAKNIYYNNKNQFLPPFFFLFADEDMTPTTIFLFLLFHRHVPKSIFKNLLCFHEPNFKEKSWRKIKRIYFT